MRSWIEVVRVPLYLDEPCLVLKSLPNIFTVDKPTMLIEINLSSYDKPSNHKPNYRELQNDNSYTNGSTQSYLSTQTGLLSTGTISPLSIFATKFQQEFLVFFSCQAFNLHIFNSPLSTGERTTCCGEKNISISIYTCYMHTSTHFFYYRRSLDWICTPHLYYD